MLTKDLVPTVRNLVTKTDEIYLKSETKQQYTRCKSYKDVSCLIQKPYISNPKI